MWAVNNKVKAEGLQEHFFGVENCFLAIVNFLDGSGNELKA
jgi:hypothetical protein